jgi:hypothetical protein
LEPLPATYLSLLPHRSPLTFQPSQVRWRTPVGGGVRPSAFLWAPLATRLAVVHETPVAVMWLRSTPGGFAAYLRARGDGADATWDSFDPPADGGRPASDTVVSRAGEGERVESAGREGLIKGALADLRVTELALDGPYDGPGVQRGDGRVDAYFEVDGRLLQVRAPGSA